VRLMILISGFRFKKTLNISDVIATTCYHEK
jgi:hypothetical protein